MEQSANGQIEVGLHFSHVASRLSIKLLSANKVLIYYILTQKNTRMIKLYMIFIPCYKDNISIMIVENKTGTWM